ncbi:hypothetical protein AB0B88_16375 [Micromonospora haikouensis]|uniref:hypothetical protein n=1 Tax=Actinomycetes TaxID=1760 RepID=UPI0033DBF22E
MTKGIEPGHHAIGGRCSRCTLVVADAGGPTLAGQRACRRVHRASWEVSSADGRAEVANDCIIDNGGVLLSYLRPGELHGYDVEYREILGLEENAPLGEPRSFGRVEGAGRQWRAWNVHGDQVLDVLDEAEVMGSHSRALWCLWLTNRITAPGEGMSVMVVRSGSRETYEAAVEGLRRYRVRIRNTEPGEGRQ